MRAVTTAGRPGAQARRFLVVATLAAPVLLGLYVFRDYGLPWDEPVQRTLGRQAWRFAFEGNPAYLSNPDRYYGVAFEMALFAAERLLGLEGQARDVFRMRHLLNFLAFWGASLCLFDLARRRLGSSRLGLVAVLALLGSPRLFADAFYNTKDLAFLSFFVVGVFTLDRFVERPSVFRAVAHGLACAFATDIRLAGALLPAMTLLAFAVVERERDRSGRRARLATLGWFCAAAGAGVIAFWPFLWADPVARFLASFRRMAHYPWDGEMLFAGRVVSASELPWSYVPVWIAVTTPLGLFPPFAVGAFQAARLLVAREGLPALGRARGGVLLVWLLAPVALAIALRSVLYDGWRQLYFVYPAFVLLATAGLGSAWRTLRSRGASGWLRLPCVAVIAFFAIDMAATTAWMVRWHPHQNVYFNAAAGNAEQVSRRFELDYWGLGCRRLLEQILATDSRERIAIRAPAGPCWHNVRLLPPVERRRLVPASAESEADYVVQHHRNHLHPPPVAEAGLGVRVDGLLIASARRIDRAAGPPAASGADATADRRRESR
jgi:hypothetical protein